MEPDFSGYATKAGLVCTDGRVITPDAFKHQDKAKVPLVWQHSHGTPGNILGHAILEHRSDGMYAKAYFNATDMAKNAKELVIHKDITQMSIWANQLVEKAKQVLHGSIKEVSLVLSGANPGAVIEHVNVVHSDGDIEDIEDEAIIYTGLTLQHADGEGDDGDGDGETGDLTVKDIYDALTEEQKNVVHYMIGVALQSQQTAAHSDKSSEAGTETQTDDEWKAEMTRNVFELAAAAKASASGESKGPVLTHDQMSTIFTDSQKLGSFKDAILAHASDYGITNIELLFPDAQAIDTKPEWITRRMEWVETVINGTRKLPFSKIKSLSADLTHEEARAKGYIKANMKKDQFFSLAKRETGPKTIYKKQKLDRDDIIDITDFDVVSWLWVEMRFMLREEIARAVLVGDGREVDDPDKIDEDKIRPIATDDSFYTDVVSVPANVGGSSLVEAIVRARENYKGSDNPTAFMTRSVLNDMLLVKDTTGRRLYRNTAELAAELEVREIVLVPVMEGAMTDDGDLLIILVNLSDYAIGSTRGGEITTFDDFDIDYNQYKYLIEGRMSGALTKHKTAQVIVREAGTKVTPTAPTFVPATGVVTIPSVTGAVYKNQTTDAVLTAGAQTALTPGQTLSVKVQPTAGYYFPHNFDTDWDFTKA
jgi:Phage capsid family/Caudovirus prohead serine protease